MTAPISKQEMLAMAGRDLGHSSWLKIDQDRIDLFADATNDHQFIHVDPVRAAATPLGGPIAHGFLSLSLISYLTGELAVTPENMVMVYNYGLDRVRFLQPVKVDDEVRAHVLVKQVGEKEPGRIRLEYAVTIEIKNHEKPALVADVIAMYVLAV